MNKKPLIYVIEEGYNYKVSNEIKLIPKRIKILKFKKLNKIIKA